jgi:hypothetical protein
MFIYKLRYNDKETAITDLIVKKNKFIRINSELNIKLKQNVHI